MKTVLAKVTDTNNRGRGVMSVQVDFDAGIDMAFGRDGEFQRPEKIIHDGMTYYFSRHGRDVATGRTNTVELVGERDARIWSNLDATEIWED